MLLFSITVPVYGAEKYINQCLDSILSQDFEDFEVILIDDGSPDKSGAICDEYAAKDSRVRVIHKENGGTIAARLDGAKAANGEYIVPVDSDDYILPGLLSSLANVVMEHDPQIICYNYIRDEEPMGRCPEALKNCFLSGEEWNKHKKCLIYDESITGFNWGLVTYCLCSKVFKRDYYLKYQSEVPKEIVRGEDIAVSAPALCHSENVYFLDFDGYFYRNTESSQMNSFREKDMKHFMTLYNYLLPRVGKVNENALNVFLFSNAREYIIRAARAYGSAEYKACIKENITPEVRSVIKSAKVGPLLLKEKIVTTLVKLKMYSLLRIIVRI